MPQCAAGENCKKKQDAAVDAHQCPGCKTNIHQGCGNRIRGNEMHKFSFLCPSCSLCAAGDLCQMKLDDTGLGYAHMRHKCNACKKNVHIICGNTTSEDATTCFKCSNTIGGQNHAPTMDLPPESVPPQASRSTAIVQGNESTLTAQELLSLEVYRAGMNPENVYRQQNADSTFAKHNGENERFLWWLYCDSRFKHTCLDPELVAEADAKKRDIGYPEKLLRRIISLPLAEQQRQKEKYTEMTIRKIFASCLGKQGHEPSRPTIVFEAITSEVFVLYLCHKRKATKNKGMAILKPQGYKGMRSSLSFLFKRYGKKMCETQYEKISSAMKGVSRVANQARQKGEGNIEDGKRELSFELYCAFNGWCVKDGSPESLFARAFSTKTWNLACRGDSTSQILTKHLIWRVDFTGIAFAHSKEEQTGADRRKRRPRHCYPNPLNWKADMMSADMEYLACFPQVLDDPQGRFFPSGSDDSVTSRFSKQMDAILKKHKNEVKQMGYALEDIGVHSWRKGAHTYMNSGSTAGPSAAATCIRGGHTMGAVRDIYVLHEKAGDHYCGRILAGLPVNDPHFAISFPDFVPLEDNMTENELEDASKHVTAAVTRALDELFGNRLQRVPGIIPFLKVGLASHLKHRDELEKEYPLTSPVRFSPLFTSQRLLDLKKYVKIALPWKNGGIAYATGIPPHTMLLSGQEELKAILRGIIPEIEKVMDDRSMSGNLSESRMRSIVTNEMRQLRAFIVKQSSALGRAGGAGSNRQANQVEMDRTGLHKVWMIDGKLRRVPPNWSFPCGPFINTYRYWHHGDEVEQISPMKYFVKKDVAWNKNQNRWVKQLEEAQVICRKLDKAAKEKNLLSEVPGRIEVINAFYGAKDVFGITDTTPTGRKRNFSKMTLGTIVREARRKARRTT